MQVYTGIIYRCRKYTKPNSEPISLLASVSSSPLTRHVWRESDLRAGSSTARRIRADTISTQSSSTRTRGSDSFWRSLCSLRIWLLEAGTRQSREAVRLQHLLLKRRAVAEKLICRELKREKAWSRIHLVPLLMAEGDRDVHRRNEAALAREREIMKDVE